MKQTQTKWSLGEEKLLKDNYGKLTYSEINKMLPDRTTFQIRNKCNYMGLCSTNNLRKYSINKEYFKIPNSQNSYWAGFIAADGCISDNGKLSIGLKRDDIEHLQQFTMDISYTNPPKLYKDRCSVTINCKEICNDLTTYFNITSRKSKTLQPPNLTDETNIAAFIKGVIDGDGSIMDNIIVIYGTKALLDWIKSYFDKWTTPSNYKKAEVRQCQEHLFYYRIGTKRKHEIFNKLKSLNNYGLKRKW